MAAAVDISRNLRDRFERVARYGVEFEQQV